MIPQTFKSPAKLNLFLYIMGQRQDGYHELQTLFQFIDYYDELAFTVNTSGELYLLTQTGITNHPEENLILKAAALLKKTYHSPLGCTISLCKKIPVGAGLGGGSSNAATALLVLNKLWRCDATIKELSQLGLQLGADVPFFVLGLSSFAEGIGEVLTPWTLPKQWYLVLSPPCTVSTKAIFSHKKLTRNTERMKIQGFEKALLDCSKNDCVPVVTELYPLVQEALDWLSRFGEARLTGTGACVFTAFNTEKKVREVLSLVRLPMQGFVAQGLNVSPLHQQLDSV